MSLLTDLFLTFAGIGLFTFGGGYAMIALIENICVEKKQWITHDEMMNITVIAESTPGPIAINCATYVGYKKKGFIGALIATVGWCSPPSASSSPYPGSWTTFWRSPGSPMPSRGSRSPWGS